MFFSFSVFFFVEEEEGAGHAWLAKVQACEGASCVVRAASWVLTCVVSCCFLRAQAVAQCVSRAGVCKCIVAQECTGMRGEAFLAEPPGSARDVPRAPRLVERGCRGVQSAAQ